jgi:hypothetical protein
VRGGGARVGEEHEGTREKMNRSGGGLGGCGGGPKQCFAG